MDAGETPCDADDGVPIQFSGEHLFVKFNAPRGELRVEVLDSGNRQGHCAVCGYQLCPVAVRQNSRARDVARGAQTFAPVRGINNVRLRFTLANGSLYSFWVGSRDKSGRSDGYVAAGGPGFPSTLDTVATPFQTGELRGHFLTKRAALSSSRSGREVHRFETASPTLSRVAGKPGPPAAT